MRAVVRGWPGNSCRAGAGARDGRRPEGIGRSAGHKVHRRIFLKGLRMRPCSRHMQQGTDGLRGPFFLCRLRAVRAGAPGCRPRMPGRRRRAAGARGAAECAVSRPVGSGSRFVRRCGTFCGRFSGPNVEKSPRELGISWNISYLWMQKMSFAANNIIRIS